MTSEFNIETPGVYSFKTLFLMTIAVLSLFEMGTNTLGIVLLVWGVFTLLRSAWLLETMLKSKPGTVRSRLLPWIILNGMEKRKRTLLAKKAFCLFNWPVFFWFVCAGLYACGTLADSLTSNVPTEQSEALPLITAFFETQGQPYMPNNAAALQHKVMMFGQPLLVGMAFFMAHSYAYTDDTSDRIWWGPFFLFVLLMLAYITFFGFSFSGPFFPQDHKIFMYLAGILSIWIFTHAWRRAFERARYAQLGIFSVIAMMLCDVFVVIPDNALALWLSGWVSVSVLWVRALGDESKKYLLYKN